MPKIKLDAYTIIKRAIEEGVAWGVMRSFKQHEHPTEEVLKYNLENEIGIALSEVIDYETLEVTDPEAAE
jgi:hypothetical protein